MLYFLSPRNALVMWSMQFVFEMEPGLKGGIDFGLTLRVGQCSRLPRSTVPL